MKNLVKTHFSAPDKPRICVIYAIFLAGTGYIFLKVVPNTRPNRRYVSPFSICQYRVLSILCTVFYYLPREATRIGPLKMASKSSILNFFQPLSAATPQDRPQLGGRIVADILGEIVRNVTNKKSKTSKHTGR